MAIKLTRRTVVLAKTETTYGEDAVAGAVDGVLCDMAPELTIDGEKIERDSVRDNLSPQGHVIGAKQLGIKLTVEGKGGGLDSGVLAPEYAPLLLACGLQQDAPVFLPVSGVTGTFVLGETVTASGGGSGTLAQILSGALVLVDVADGPIADTETLTGGTSSATATVDGTPVDCVGYRPVSDPASVQSCTVNFYRDGSLHKALGCLGDLEVDWSVGKIPKFTFNLKGLWVDPAAVAMPTPELVALTPPVVAGIGLTVGGFTPVASKLALKLGVEVSERPDLNAAEGLAGFRITGRRPTGSLDPEADALGTFNPFTAWKNATAAALGGTVGAASGNRCGLFVPQALYESVAYGDRDGLVTYDLPFLCKAASDAGDNEVRFIFS